MELKTLMDALHPTEQQYLEQALSQPVRSIQTNEEIELTVEEIAKAIGDAKIKKGIALQYEENEKIRRRKSEIIMKAFNSEELINYCQEFFVQRFQKEFVVDDDNRGIVEHLAKYFTNDEEFNIGNFNLSKGLLIMGPVGTGKSGLMTFFQKNKKRCYAIKSCNDISEDYLFLKDELENVYSNPIEKPLHDPAVFFQKYIGYCFDDLGTEQVRNSYGNKKDTMADILFAIYNKKDFEKFHVTTNLNKKELEERYGSRIFSRFQEMFNFFVYDGKDRRK